ncbi:MAG: type II toxin-antitoxin system VapC family toxin [Candidatus Limnocylindrales bacterium]
MILDASVAVKWFLPDEDEVAEARHLRSAALTRSVELVAPDILWAEVCQSLVRAVRRGRVERDAARAVVDDLVEVRPLVMDSAVDLRDAMRIALAVGVSAYDAQYLALGARLGQPVITADRRMFDRGRAHGFEVVWLGGLAEPVGHTP